MHLFNTDATDAAAAATTTTMTRVKMIVGKSDSR